MVKAVEPDQIHALLNNAQTFSQALADSSDNVKALVRDGAVLAGHLNNSANRLDTALIDADSLLKAVNSQKIAGIVNSASEVVQTVHQNRGNIDSTLKNVSEMSAKLNEFRRQGRRRADKPRKISSARRAQRARLTASARRRFRSRNSPTMSTRGSKISRAASAGSPIRACANTRRSPLRRRGRSKTLTESCDHSDAIQVRSYSGQDPRCPSITAGNDGAKGGWIPSSIEICRCGHPRTRGFGMRERASSDPV